jgi:hypothetical protein
VTLLNTTGKGTYYKNQAKKKETSAFTSTALRKF